MRLYERKGKRIGNYDEERGILHKFGVKPSKHLMRKYNAYGVDAKMLEALPDDTKVIVHDTENKVDLVATKRKIMTLGRKSMGSFSDDFGEQWFLPVKHWRKPNQGEQQALFL